jgi:AraC-like DNA-binding protein
MSGRLILTSDGRQTVARAGDILFYRNGFVHEERSDPRQPVCTAFLSFEVGDLLSSLPLVTHDEQGRVGQLVRWIVDDELSGESSDRRGLYLEALLGELHGIAKTPVDPWLDRTRAFIASELARDLSLDDLARHAGMSKYAFLRKFKRLSGRTPMEEVRHARLDRARSLLLTTDLPIKAIASAVGFADVYRMSKLFRSHFDHPPSLLRSRPARRR